MVYGERCSIPPGGLGLFYEPKYLLGIASSICNSTSASLMMTNLSDLFLIGNPSDANSLPSGTTFAAL